MLATASVLQPFARQNTVLLTTFRPDGTPVGTPVHIAVEDDHAFIRTWDTAWKLKRLRGDPRVEIAPSTVGGTPTGPSIPARARVLTGEESKHAAGLLAHKYPILHGFLIPLVHRLRGNTTMHVELTPLS